MNKSKKEKIGLASLPIEARFKAGSEPRAKNAIRYIRMITKTIQSPNYKPTLEEVEAISERLHTEVDKILNAFNTSKPNTKEVEDIF